MWLHLYNFLLLLAYPYVRLRLIIRSLTAPGYAERVPERYGFVSESLKQPLWFHTVSAGEAIAAAPIIKQLALDHPDLDILVTSTTVTGSEQIRRLLTEQVRHVYMPYDFSWVIKRFLNTVNPCVLVLMETEMWPNLLHELKHRAIPALLMNARMSERSFKGYRRIYGLSRPMFNSLAWSGCQYLNHAQRLQELGVEPNRLTVTGNVKFDVQPPADLQIKSDELRSAWHLNDRKIWIAASTHEGEERLILEVQLKLRKKYSNLLLLLVPRHPERFKSVQQMAESAGLVTAPISQMSALNHDAALNQGKQPEVLIGDEMGRLMYLYALAQVVFMGGTLVDIGGHNIIEPAVLNKPVIAGPSRHNFSEVYALFETEDALKSVSTADELYVCVDSLLGSESKCARMGMRAAQVVNANAGATAKVLECLNPFIRNGL